MLVSVLRLSVSPSVRPSVCLSGRLPVIHFPLLAPLRSLPPSLSPSVPSPVPSPLFGGRGPQRNRGEGGREAGSNNAIRAFPPPLLLLLLLLLRLFQLLPHTCVTDKRDSGSNERLGGNEPPPRAVWLRLNFCLCNAPSSNHISGLALPSSFATELPGAGGRLGEICAVIAYFWPAHFLTHISQFATQTVCEVIRRANRLKT